MYCAGERRGTSQSRPECRRHQFAAVPPCARTQIDHIIRAADRFFIVLDDQHGVPQSRKSSSACSSRPLSR